MWHTCRNSRCPVFPSRYTHCILLERGIYFQGLAWLYHSLWIPFYPLSVLAQGKRRKRVYFLKLQCCTSNPHLAALIGTRIPIAQLSDHLVTYHVDRRVVLAVVVRWEPYCHYVRTSCFSCPAVLASTSTSPPPRRLCSPSLPFWALCAPTLRHLFPPVANDAFPAEAAAGPSCKLVKCQLRVAGVRDDSVQDGGAGRCVGWVKAHAVVFL